MKEYIKYLLIAGVFILALLLVINKAKQVENICVNNYENYIKARCECESSQVFIPNNNNIDWGSLKNANKDFS